LTRSSNSLLQSPRRSARRRSSSQESAGDLPSLGKGRKTSACWRDSLCATSGEVVPNLVELEEVAVPRLKPAVW
jgi:hypothetical protein